MKTSIELADQAGLVKASHGWVDIDWTGLDRLLELHHAQVIQELATVEGGQTVWKYEPYEGWWPFPCPDDDDFKPIVTYTAKQVAAARVKDWVEIGLLKAERERNLDSIRVNNEIISKKNAELDALQGVDTRNIELIAENQALQARVSELECEAEQLRKGHFDVSESNGKLRERVRELCDLVRKVHKAKGRYHTQLAMCDLFDSVGLANERPVAARAKEAQ